MKILKTTSVLMFALIATRAFAAEYICNEADRRESYVPYRGQLIIDVVGDQAIVKGEKETTSYTVKLGERVDNGSSRVCVQREDRGMCLIGANDPYELCRTVCSLYADEKHSSIISLSPDQTFLIVSWEAEAKYQESSLFGIVKKQQVRSSNIDIRCNLKEMIALRDGQLDGKSYDKILNWLGTPVMLSSRSDRNTDTFQALRLNNGETRTVTSEELGRALLNGEAKIVDMKFLTQNFDLRAVHRANCYSRGTEEIIQFVYTRTGDKITIQALNPNARRILLDGVMISIAGTSKVLVGDKDVVTAKTITKTEFSLSGLACHVIN